MLKLTISKVCSALKLNNGQQLLLAVAWVHKKAITEFKKYPEVVGFDVTYGTNQEKRPLAKGTLINSSSKNIPFFNAILPSQCRWVFHWIFDTAIPNLFPSEYLKKIQLFITDEDPNCYEMIERSRSHYPVYKHRICKWHKVSCLCTNLIIICKYPNNYL